MSMGKGQQCLQELFQMTRNYSKYSSSDLRNGGVLAVIRTSFPLPARRAFNEDLCPKDTRPDFMTSARREDRASPDLLVLPAFLTAILI